MKDINKMEKFEEACQSILEKMSELKEVLEEIKEGKVRRNYYEKIF